MKLWLFAFAFLALSIALWVFAPSAPCMGRCLTAGSHCYTSQACSPGCVCLDETCVGID